MKKLRLQFFHENKRLINFNLFAEWIDYCFEKNITWVVFLVLTSTGFLIWIFEPRPGPPPPLGELQSIPGRSRAAAHRPGSGHCPVAKNAFSHFAFFSKCCMQLLLLQNASEIVNFHETKKISSIVSLNFADFCQNFTIQKNLRTSVKPLNDKPWNGLIL